MLTFVNSDLKKAPVRLEHHPDQQLLEVHLNGFMLTEVGKATWEEVFQLVLNKNVTRLLINAKDGRIITPEAMRWMQDEYFPRVQKALASNNRHLRIARVEPDDIFGRVQAPQLDAHVHRTVSAIEFRPFETEAAAREWLLS